MRLLLPAAFLLAAARVAAQEGLVDRGQAVAEAQCARCHVVGAFNPMGGISSTPSFQMMVNNIPDWQARFETFHVRPPHAAIVRFEGDPVDESRLLTTEEMLLEIEDLAALSAFAATLADE